MYINQLYIILVRSRNITVECLGGVLLYWICESCGYENESADESLPGICRCCGENASRNIITQAKKELEELRKEEKRKARIEILEKRKNKLNSIFTKILKVFNIAPAVISLCLVLSIIIMVLSIPIKSISFEAWHKALSRNANSLSVVGYSENFLKNANNLNIDNRLTFPFQNLYSVTEDCFTDFFDDILNNIEKIGKDHKEFSKNFDKLLKSNEQRFNDTGKNIENNGDNYTDLGENYISNFDEFISNMQENFNNIADILTGKG